ncbi:MAG: protoporphyrinogen oxidase [Methylotenera sp.]|nr:protoporphyrinogen oxidase [Oligoflexia bacterium]
MLGRIDPSRKNVTVVGAGISGLLTAYYLDARGYQVTLLEKSSEVGGLIQSHSLPTGLAESAAHSLLATPPVLELCEKLGVELFSVQENSKARFIFRDARMQKLPLKFLEILGAIRRALFARSTGQEITVQDWALKHLGQAPATYLMTPMLRGIYGASPAEISLTAAFPKLQIPAGKTLLGYFVGNFIKARISILRGRSSSRARPRMMTPRGGMHEIVAALETSLQSTLQDRFKKGTEVQDLGTLLNSGTTVILCTPAQVAAQLIMGLDAAGAALARELRQIPYSPMVSVTAHVPTAAFAEAPHGVGVLMPPSTDRKCLGILFNSSSFPQRVNTLDWQSFTLMLGGSQGEKWLAFSDEELSGVVRQELIEVLKMESQAEVKLKIFRWPRAIPLYSAELEKNWQRIEEGLPKGLVLCSNYTGQVSIRGILENLHSRLEPASRS